MTGLGRVSGDDRVLGTGGNRSRPLCEHEVLVAAHGGRQTFAEHLERLFNLPEKVEGMGFALDATGLIGPYAHGNEPRHRDLMPGRRSRNGRRKSCPRPTDYK